MSWLRQRRVTAKFFVPFVVFVPSQATPTACYDILSHASSNQPFALCGRKRSGSGWAYGTKNPSLGAESGPGALDVSWGIFSPTSAPHAFFSSRSPPPLSPHQVCGRTLYNNGNNGNDGNNGNNGNNGDLQPAECPESRNHILRIFGEDSLFSRP